jgi:hypothetical protein
MTSTSDPDAAATAPARKPLLLRLDPAIHRALSQWAADELRSLNAQIDFILRDALRRTGRLPPGLRPARRPGRPRAGGGPDGGPTGPDGPRQR